MAELSYAGGGYRVVGMLDRIRRPTGPCVAPPIDPTVRLLTYIDRLLFNDYVAQRPLTSPTLERS